MIDTDKYKGHTPAPWYFWCGGVSTGPVASGKDITKSKVNGKLIADAPLLLEEVKRLRMYEVAWKMLYDNAIEEERETRTRTWKEIMELVRCDVREMVDTGDAVFDEWAKQIIGGFE